MRMVVFVLALIAALVCVNAAPFVTQQVVHTPGFEWTAEEMAKAVPKTRILNADGSHNATESLRVCAGYKWTKWTTASSYTTPPFPSVGKVFFKMGGSTYVCSASIGGDNIIWTAGHCIYDPDYREWATEFIFIPQYFAGAAPHGQFKGANLYATTQWQKNDISYDYALVRSTTTFPTNLARLSLRTDLTPSSVSYTSFGYPAGTPFNGEYENTCTSTGCYRDTSTSPNSVGISCDSTGGCSGGPWVVEGRYIVSVNSYGYNNRPNVLYGPFFNTATSTFFRAVGSAIAQEEQQQQQAKTY